MCRTAGRRCPSYSDPVAIAARNARRRAAYAAKKGRVTPETSSPEESPTTSPLPQGLGVSKIAAGPVEGIPEEDQALFQAEIVRGVINYKELDEHSYEEFGFKNPHEDHLIERMPVWTTLATSSVELQALSADEATACSLFTTSHAYKSINKYAYHPENLKTLVSLDLGPAQDRLHTLGDDDDYEDTFDRDLLKIHTDLLDQALAKGFRRQRFTYRGLNAKELSDVYLDSPEEVESWVDEHRSLGTEVIFDGYTSTSADPNIAHGFNKTVMYEMLTPEGVAISDRSYHSEEEEILLPRKQRYMVVGVHKEVPYSDDGEFPEMTLIQLVAINSKGEILDGTNSDPIEPLVP